MDEQTLRVSENRSFVVAEAAVRLLNRGYEATIENGAANFSISERERIILAIEEDIKAFGPCRVLMTLFTSRRFSEKMERYLSSSGVTTLPKWREPSVPLNLLVQLSIKQLGTCDFSQAPDEAAFERLVRLSTDLAAIYDVEPYSPWELEFRNVHSVLPYITKLAFHDRLFGFRQYRAADVPNALRGLFDWVPKSTETSLGWKISNAVKVAECLLGGAEHHGVNIIPPATLLQECQAAGVPRLEAEKIIDAFCHQNPPNPEFTLPEGAINFAEKPLIRNTDGSLVLASKALCAPSFYEAIATAVRPFDSQTQSNIGKSAERLLLKELKDRNIPVVSGDYSTALGDGECDAVIETDDTIIFLELKGKPLTNAAQAGSDEMICLDLFKSLFNAIFQANQHEIILRQQGSLLLERDGAKYLLELRGRQIEKIAVTLLDFGRFQDRSVLTQVLTTLLSAKLSPIDPDKSKDFDKLNERTSLLRTQIESLGKIDPDAASQPFFTSWFLSLPQILVLLDEVTSAADLKSALWKTRHFRTHSLDWYSEMQHAADLESSRPKTDQRSKVNPVA